MTARTSHANGNKVLAFVAVAIQHRLQHHQEVFNKRLRSVLVQDIFRYRLVCPAETTQFRHPIWVGKKAHIHDQISIPLGAMSETKGMYGHMLLVADHRTKGSFDSAAQVMNRWRGRFNTGVCSLTSRRHGSEFPLNAHL